MKPILAIASASLLASTALIGSAMAGDNYEKDAETQIESDAGTSAGADVDTSAGADLETDSDADAGTSAGADDDMGASGEAGTDLSSDSDAEAGVDTGTTAATGGEGDLENAISAIGVGGAGATEIEMMTDATNVEVVRIGESEGGSGSAELESAVSDNQDEIDDLRSAIESNSALSDKLNEEDVDASDVVAAQSEADGSLTVYAQ